MFEAVLGNALFWIVSVVIGALFVGILGYCGLRDDSEPKTYGIGDTHEMGDFLVTVTGPADCSPPPTTTRPTFFPTTTPQSTTAIAPPTTKTCRVPLRVRNQSDQSKSFQPLYNHFGVGGQEYNTTSTSGWARDVFPHAVKETVVEASMPVGIDPDKLVLDGKEWSLIEDRVTN